MYETQMEANTHTHGKEPENKPWFGDSDLTLLSVFRTVLPPHYDQKDSGDR